MNNTCQLCRKPVELGFMADSIDPGQKSLTPRQTTEQSNRSEQGVLEHNRVDPRPTSVEPDPRGGSISFHQRAPKQGSRLKVMFNWLYLCHSQ
jgi:hypothetical protein